MIASTGQKIFKAAFESRCPKCKGRVEVGDEMVRWGWDPTGKDRAVHLNCAGGVPEDPAPETSTPASETGEVEETKVEESPELETPELETKVAHREWKCPICDEQVEKGETVAAHLHMKYGSRRAWVHLDCADVLPSQEVAKEPRKVKDDLAENAVSGLRETLGVIFDELNEITNRTTNKATGELESRLAKIEESIAKVGVRSVEVKLPTGEVNKIDEVTHTAFDEILRLAAMGEDIFLPGPAGCGKSHAAHQVATALGRRFGMVSCTVGMSEGQLTGRLLPTGESGAFQFVTTEFIRCYEEGGVFLLDEMDGADPNVLLVINSALANGKLALPNRPEKPYADRHEDFVLIAAANTIGKGADRDYTGRNRLDAATLDRFKFGTVPMDYCPEIDKAVCPDDKLRERLTKVRAALRELKSAEFVSTRFMAKAYRAKQAGFTWVEIEHKMIFGWSDDLVQRVKAILER